MPRVLAVVLAFVVGGAAAGLAWVEVVWTPARGVVQDGRWFPADERALAMTTGGTSTYVAVAAVTGLLLGVLSAVLAARLELVVLVTVLVGSAAAAYLMWQVGVWLAPPDPAAAAATAADGTRLPGALVVTGATPFLALPAGALAGLTGVFLASPAAGRG